MTDLVLDADASRPGLQPGLHEQNSALSVTEQVCYLVSTWRNVGGGGGGIFVLLCFYWT